MLVGNKIDPLFNFKSKYSPETLTRNVMNECCMTAWSLSNRMRFNL